MNLGYSFSLGGQFGKDELQKIEVIGKGRTRDKVPYLKVNYAFIDDPAKLRKEADKYNKFVKGRSQKGKQLSVILMKLARKLILELPRKNLVFNPK